jgi:hypothetical protein
LRSIDRQIEGRILELLAQSPSGLHSRELERLLQPKATGRGGLKDSSIMAVRRLCHAGAIEIRKSGRMVEPEKARAPFCLRAVRRN